MTDTIHTLLRKTSLRKAIKTLTMDELDKLASDLTDLIEERKAQEAEELAAQAEKLRKVAELREAMAKAGISLDDLESAGGAKPQKTKTAVKPKYQVKDAAGNIVQWTGRGRTPRAFQQYFDKGGRKEDCLI